MEILIVTNACSEKKSKELYECSQKKHIDPQVKFFRLLAEGLAAYPETTVTVISSLPVSASTSVQKHFSYEVDEMGNLRYQYMPFINGRIARFLTLFLSTMRFVTCWNKNAHKKKRVIITDPLIPELAIPTRMIAKIRGIKVGAVITDLPSLTTQMKERKESKIKELLLKLYQKTAAQNLLKYDFYVPLTKSLNEVANPLAKPFCIVEGFADRKDTEMSSKHGSYIMYAGGLYEKFGLKALVDGFSELKNPGVELWLFGEGSYVPNIMAKAEKNPGIRYKGCVTAEEAVRLEKEALLLVNPRPVSEEFVKYSFPSKTIEYLLSGTPTVSTRLPGIPKEYFDYLYAFDGDSQEAIATSLTRILALPEEERMKRGQRGHDFVLREKNNQVMAGKVLALLQEVVL